MDKKFKKLLKKVCKVPESTLSPATQQAAYKHTQETIRRYNELAAVFDRK